MVAVNALAKPFLSAVEMGEEEGDVAASEPPAVTRQPSFVFHQITINGDQNTLNFSSDPNKQ